LAKLTALQSLDCGNTEVADLGPLVKLTALQRLNCAATQVGDLGPLAKLTALQRLDCGLTQVGDLGPLEKLTALQSLDCRDTNVSDLGPLAKLTALQSLHCSGTQVADLGPLAKLAELQSLNCGDTRVADLGPLERLTALQSLGCRGTKVSDLGPLAKLTALRLLDCRGTKVSDLGPLAKLTALQLLDCSRCNLSSVPETFWHKPSLKRLVLYQTRVPGVPAEVLSQGPFDDCLESLRADFKDVAAGAEALTDVKLLVLGNGRSGKTQLTRRLANQPFQPEWDSTHGIRVAFAALPAGVGGAATRLNIWDFGGQDIYHGTHALFVRSRALFVLVWARDTEAPAEYEHEGISFRNHPLLYWVEYVRHLAAAESPVVIVQTKCDRDADEEPRAPIPDEALKALGFCRELHFSACNDRGRDELEAALLGAVAWLRDRQGIAQIGAGRLRVQRRLEGLRDADGALPPEYRLIDRATFRAWCEEAGGVSSPDHLLAYLHNAGIVFYQAGLFHDQIVLDHAWALNAMYALFDRTRCYRRLQKEGGRFDRLRLEELIWKEQRYSADDQRLFLSMMRSCCICFVYRRGPRGIEDDETIYIAPDLLPGRDAVQTDLDDRWGGPPDPPACWMTFDYALLHPGLMRSVIARIGDQAGLDAIYWRGGVYVYETTTRSRALIEEEMHGWRGTVRLATKGGQGSELLDRLAAWIGEENDRMGLRPEVKTSALLALAATARPDVPSFIGNMRRAALLTDLPAARVDTPPTAPLKFAAEPITDFDYAVSYAWGDDTPEGKEREAHVDRLCAEAVHRGRRILRDKAAMGLGDRISEFMRRLAKGKRVFIILSDKYLRSAFCTFELYEVWRNSRMDDRDFLRRVKVFKMPEVRISNFAERKVYYSWWKQQLADRRDLIDEIEPSALPALELQYYKAMRQFADDVLEILLLVSDTLRPATWDDFLRDGFDDPGR
jgi:internalin A